MRRKIFVGLAVILAILLTACGATGGVPADDPHLDVVIEVTEENAHEEPQEPAEQEPSPEITEATTETENIYLADALFLLQTVEDVHPIFVFARGALLPEDYDEVRENFLTEAAKAESLADFALAAQRFLVVLRDGHMGGGFNVIVDVDGSRQRALIFRFLQTNFVYSDGRLLLASDRTMEVVAIGGVPVADVFYQIDRHFFAENASDRRFQRQSQAGHEGMLVLAGAEIYTEGLDTFVDLILTDGENGKTVYPMRFGELGIRYGTAPVTDNIIYHEMIGDVFYIRLTRFTDGDHITEVAAQVQQAVAEGTRQFIVDLRRNGGGNSVAGSRLLDAMGISLPNLGVFRRNSELAREQRPNTFFGERMNVDFAPSPLVAANPNDVFVAVLTDIYSYSSATMMATWVADGGFGMIVGEPSRNNPSRFGDMLFVALPETGLELRVSYTRFLRPDIHADQFTLYPDIMVNSEDALEAALDFLGSLE